MISVFKTEVDCCQKFVRAGRLDHIPTYLRCQGVWFNVNESNKQESENQTHVLFELARSECEPHYHFIGKSCIRHLLGNHLISFILIPLIVGLNFHFSLPSKPPLILLLEMALGFACILHVLVIFCNSVNNIIVTDTKQ